MRLLDKDLKSLRESIMAMAGLAEEMIDRTMQALVEQSSAQAEKVNELDRRMDEWELTLDHLCVELLALKAPAASDLRFIASSLKIVPELERIGDHCCNIARRGPLVHPSILTDGSLETLGLETRRMVGKAVDAFVGSDAKLAREVIANDDIVDALYTRIYQALLSLMKTDPLLVDRASHLILIIKNWERIADQATNIAEEVLYILEGHSAKHPYLSK